MSAATTLTFDDLGFSDSIGTFSGQAYIDQGVIISSDGSTPLSYAVDGWQGMISHSGSYCVAVGNGDPWDWGALTFEFVSPGTLTPTLANNVSIWTGDESRESDMIIATAYSSVGAVLVADTFETQSYSQNTPELGQLVLPTTDISYITVSTSHPVAVDDVSFGLSGQDPSRVPSASPLAMIALMLILAAAGVTATRILSKRRL